MSNTNFDELLNAGCHFGHLTRKWNPKMAPYIFMERNDIHIIDLNKTAIMLDKASAALKKMSRYNSVYQRVTFQIHQIIIFSFTYKSVRK